ncbi:MAG: protein kinase domain-containing protein [Ardenticatenaceae bacterium]
MINELLDDRYKLYERLGEGGMAEVFRGEDLRLGREVAVKALRAQYSAEKSFLDRFINEARSMAGFSHPNVVNVYDVGRDGQRYYLVMEYVPGEDLRQMLERVGRLPVKAALDIARKMAAGIGYAHRKGLVHRDIKPGNILITPAGDVKVADFGIAKAMASVSLTEPGIVWGTTAYLSPEQVRGQAATPASDVYSMGIVLYEMLAGHPPYQGEDRVAVALKHLQEEPPPLPDDVQAPRGLLYLMQKAVEKEPGKRFRDADEMSRSLGEYLRAGGDITTMSHPVPSIAAPPRRPQPLRPLTGEAPGQSPAVTPTDHQARAAAKELRRQRAERLPPAAMPTPRRPRSRPAPTATTRLRPSTDWGTILLGLLAALLVLGLIPLWMRVFDAIM